MLWSTLIKQSVFSGMFACFIFNSGYQYLVIINSSLNVMVPMIIVVVGD